MIAAQNVNDVGKVISYGDKALAIDPNDLNAMMIVAGAIPTKLPTDEAGKKAALDKSQDLATKALAGVGKIMATADAATKAQLTQIEGSLHSTLGLVANSKGDYNKSIQEYQQVIQRIPKDDVAHFYL